MIAEIKIYKHLLPIYYYATHGNRICIIISLEIHYLKYENLPK